MVIKLQLTNPTTGEKLFIEGVEGTPYKKVRVPTNGKRGTVGNEDPDEMFKTEIMVKTPTNKELRAELLQKIVEFMNFCEGTNRLIFYYEERQDYANATGMPITASGDCFLISNVYHDEVKYGANSAIKLDADFGEVFE